MNCIPLPSVFVVLDPARNSAVRILSSLPSCLATAGLLASAPRSDPPAAARSAPFTLAPTRAVKSAPVLSDFILSRFTCTWLPSSLFTCTLSCAVCVLVASTPTL